ncbi:MAG: DUF3990 domain-containing protein [Muribaculaceae bacterium]|nr:DUF3990 domain-containing protein [Muribaculaceae bacterium]
MTTLYHGSYTGIEHPIATLGRKNLDFGQGFYLTSLKQQAEQWAQLVTERKTRNGFPLLNIYTFDDELARQMCFRWVKFNSYDIDWLNFVVACRMGQELWKEFDIVEGGVANDQVIDTVEDYMMGIITDQQALGQLRYKNVNHQLCIINQKVIDSCLKFVVTREVKPNEK